MATAAISTPFPPMCFHFAGNALTVFIIAACRAETNDADLVVFCCVRPGHKQWAAAVAGTDSLQRRGLTCSKQMRDS